ncbi:MAG: COX15/CtaA family protein [Candidatus Rokubacteria bacterium]|nr:COX15/CtaA family protein [Candidatus Rokubacteria bacterium]
MATGPLRWAHRLAVTTACATALLIVAGGLVTNTGSALAVPDWPTTFGHNMFLYPWSRMAGGIFYEHSHRLLGSLVGLLTLGLAAALWLTERRSGLRRLGLAAVVLVCAQGLVGGLRVLLLRDALAIVHGCLAQAFFALTVALAVVTSPAWRAPATAEPPAGARTAAWLGVAASVALYLQIVLGALTTHAGWIALHLAGAVLAVALPATAALRVLARHAARPSLAWPARALGVLLAVQVTLGLGAYVARFTGLAVPGGAAAVLALPVAHRLTASLLLGAAIALTLHAWRLGRPRTAGVPESVAVPLLRRRVPA